MKTRFRIIAVSIRLSFRFDCFVDFGLTVYADHELINAVIGGRVICFVLQHDFNLAFHCFVPCLRFVELN